MARQPGEWTEVLLALSEQRSPIPNGVSDDVTIVIVELWPASERASAPPVAADVRGRVCTLTASGLGADGSWSGARGGLRVADPGRGSDPDPTFPIAVA